MSVQHHGVNGSARWSLDVLPFSVGLADPGGPYDALALAGRRREVSKACAILNDGGSVLLLGRGGDGVSSVARAVLSGRDTAPLRIVTGLPPLTDTPLGALVVGGLAPPRRIDDDVSQHVRTTLRAFEITAATRKAPLLVMVEGMGALDTYSASLLTQLVERGWAQLVVCTQLGAPGVELRPLLSLGTISQVTVPPLSDDCLRHLAPEGTCEQTVARALAVAGGSPLWFREALQARWFGDGAPMPATLREIADYHISRLAPQVVTALELTAVAGAVTPSTLARVAGEPAVRTCLDAELLRLTGGFLVMDNVFLRSRAQERASIRHRDLVDQLREAAMIHGDQLPLLQFDAPSGSAVTGPMVNALVGSAPSQVLDALSQMHPPLCEELELARARALLSTCQIPAATQVLRSLAMAAHDPRVRVDAASLLALTQARLLGDVPGARRTIAETAATIADPDLGARLGSRRVAIELFGCGTPQPIVDVPQESEVTRTDLRTRFDVLAAQMVLHAGSVHSPVADDVPLLVELVDRNVLTSLERWEGLACAALTLVTRQGVGPAISLAARELERARGHGDLGAVGSWLHVIAKLLADSGHPRVALPLARQATAALATNDLFDLRDIARATEARCLAHLGDHAAATVVLTDLHADVAPTNAYDASTRTAAQAEMWAAQGEEDQATRALGESIAHSQAMGWSAGGWSFVVSSLATTLPPTPTDVEQAGPADGLAHLTQVVATGTDTEALDAVRTMAAMGWVGAAAGGGRRRCWSTGSSRRNLEIQHVMTTCQDVAFPEVCLFPGPASRRQLNIARRAAAGLSDSDISDELGLSRRTVSNHLSRLYGTAGLSGRDDLPSVLAPVRVWRPQDSGITSG